MSKGNNNTLKLQSSYMLFLRYFSVSKFSSLSLCAPLQTLLGISVSSQPVSLCLCVCICKQCFHIYLHPDLFQVKYKFFEHTGFSSCFPHNIFTSILHFIFQKYCSTIQVNFLTTPYSKMPFKITPFRVTLIFPAFLSVCHLWA